MEGDLYFAAAEDLDYELLQCLTPRTRVVVLRMKRLRAVGSSAMAIMERFWELLHLRGIHLVVCGIEDQLKSVMTGSGLRKQLGEQNIFYADNRIFQSTELALARAWSIVEMEKRAAEASSGGPQKLDTRVNAQKILSPRILRFGSQHQIREATWLISEMMKHMERKTSQPLFLQDREGKLDAELTLWALLRAMSANLDKDEVGEMSDEDLAQSLRKWFDRPISKIARRDLPKIGVDTSLAQMVHLVNSRQFKVLPVRDENGRLKGLVSQLDLLKGIGLALDFNPEKELPNA